MSKNQMRGKMGDWFTAVAAAAKRSREALVILNHLYVLKYRNDSTETTLFVHEIDHVMFNNLGWELCVFQILIEWLLREHTGCINVH